MQLSYKEFIEQLNKGFTFEFTYMDMQHKIMGIDKKAYTVIRYEEDSMNTREHRQIVSRKVVHELYKKMTNLTYSY